MGTDGPPLCCPEHMLEEDAPSVPMRPAARRQGSPTTVLDHHTCWPCGTGKPMGDAAGTQIRSLCRVISQLGSAKKVHWVVRDECKLGLVHRWQASPNGRMSYNTGFPFSSGTAVCACNSLAVQCPEAAELWDCDTNGDLTPGDIAVQSHKLAAWKGPDGRQWQQRVDEIVNNIRRHEARVKR